MKSFAEEMRDKWEAYEEQWRRESSTKTKPQLFLDGARASLESELVRGLASFAQSMSEYHFIGEGACLFCDMGDAGDPVDEKGHDMSCAVGNAMRALAAYEQAKKDGRENV